jgi:hypothetical protein
MLTDYSTPVASEQKFRISLKNPRTGRLLKGDCEYNSLMGSTQSRRELEGFSIPDTLVCCRSRSKRGDSRRQFPWQPSSNIEQTVNNL